MKKTLIALSALLLVTFGGALWLVATPPAVGDVPVETATEQAAPAVSAPSSNLPSAAGCEEGDSILPGQDQLTCCIDECKRDRDCRAVCGFEFGGQCVQVNSCCTQCFCFGFAPVPGTPS